jgi:cephalosporin hydroxylase
VKKELNLYHGIVSNDSYLVAMDGAQGLVWDIPSGKKEWKEDNPLRAINEFLDEHRDWEADANFNRLPVTSNPKGYLKRKN